MKRVLAAAAILVTTAACSAMPAATLSATAAPSSSPDPAPTLPPPTPIPSATPPECLAKPGQVIVDEIQAEGMARSLPYRIYLPPCFEAGTQDYPVLILIHGLQSSDGQWDELGVDETADAMIRDGELPPFIIVMPWERKGLDFMASIVDVLLPHVRAAFAGEGSRATTAIGGLSRGAGWALRIGLQHPEDFGAIGLHSPAVLAPDMYYVEAWADAAEQADATPRLWIDIAERDTSRAGALELTALLDELNLAYAWSTGPGEHTGSYWSSRLEDYLSWYAEPWAINRETVTPAL
jgi:enterochelin esterase-like enzyme